MGIALLFRQERALAKTLGECFGVNTESRSDPNSGDNAGVNVAIVCSAREMGVSYISHATKDDSNKDKLTRII